MELRTIISLFNDQKRQSDGSYMVKCPCHDDRKQSLHISQKDGKILMRDFGGCDNKDILERVGLSVSDLFVEPLKTDKRDWERYVESREGKQIEAVYDYVDLSGNYAFTKIRLSGKTFIYGVLKNERFQYGLNGKSRKENPAIYCKSVKKIREAVSKGDRIFYAEGEKDVNSLTSHGLTGVTCGGSGDWNSMCSELFKGANVVILADNDKSGKDSVKKIEEDLRSVAKSVKVVIPTPDIEKGDISDFFASHTVEELNELVDKTGPESNARPEPKIKALSVSDIEEEPVEWLIPNFIPIGQISLLVGDGGQGKTSIWCNLIGGLTSGSKTLLESENPFECKKEGKTCMFFSSEDSVPKVLKKRLRASGADQSKVLFVDLKDKNFDLIKFDSPELEELISVNRPCLVVFDPLQSFIPASVQMGSRNAMRQCMSPLIALGEKYGTAFLIVMHTNKKLGVSGRTRCADSADIWDIARSVMIVGYTGESGIHYLSHEKSNYEQEEDTILYTIEDGQVIFKGTSEKKDRDYVAENSKATRTSPARDEAKEIILNILKDKELHRVADVDSAVKASGISFTTLKRAKQELKNEGKIQYKAEGYGSTKTFYVKRVSPGE